MQSTRRSFLRSSGRLLITPSFVLGLCGSAAAQTFHGNRFRGVLPQEFDMSCGIAAVRTLLAVLGSEPPPERDLVLRRLASMASERAAHALAHGFSLADLRDLLMVYGVQAVAVRGGLRQLLAVDRIGIVHLRTREGGHFAVLHGMQVDDGRLVLLDPSRGRLALKPYQLEAEWTGVALLVVSAGNRSVSIRLDVNRSTAAALAGNLWRMSKP